MGKFVNSKVEHLVQKARCVAQPTKAEMFVKKERWLFYSINIVILYGNEQPMH